MNKKIIFALFIFSLWGVGGLCQGYKVFTKNVALNSGNINQAVIPYNSSTVFISPERINYADISNEYVHGDMPDNYHFRLKIDTAKVKEGENFTVTIVAQSFVSVYKLFASSKDSQSAYVITLNPNDGVQTNQAEVLSRQQSFNLSVKAYNNKRSIYNIRSNAYGMSLWVNNIYSFGDYIMLDIGATNAAKLQFSIDQMRFKIIDKHILKATVSQDIEVQPLYTLFPIENAVIKGAWRNIILFKKFTFPTEKLFQIELNETQYSGRRIELKFEYNQLLTAQQII